MVKQANTTTLINTDDGHRKFYTVTVDGKSVHMHWGRIGTAGQKQTKTFSFSDVARQFAREKISDKLYTRGYERLAS
jgi:predicted DNA-binding WGR domain protein